MRMARCKILMKKDQFSEKYLYLFIQSLVKMVKFEKLMGLLQQSVYFVVFVYQHIVVTCQVVFNHQCTFPDTVYIYTFIFIYVPVYSI